MSSQDNLLPPELVVAAAEAAAHATAAASAVAKMMEAVHQRAMKRRAPAKNCKLPRAAGPVILRPRPPAILRFGRVHFGCPACRRSLVLSGKHCANYVSCPNCYSGIRVPDPKNGISAQNLGRTVAPLLHPERFENATDSRRFMPWLFGNLPTPAQSLNIAGALLLFAGVACLTPLLLGWATDSVPSKSFIAKGQLPSMAVPAPHGKALAKEVVKAFLAAPTAEAKAKWVLNPEASLQQLTSWYASRPAAYAAREATAEVGDVQQGFYARPGDSKVVSEVPVTTDDGLTVNYLVEHQADGPKIAWAESVGFSPVPWEKMLTSPPGDTPATLRVLACRDDYYNYAFQDESRFCCIRLHDPRTREILGYAYAERRVVIEQSLQVHLPPARSGQLQPVMVSVRPTALSAGTHQVELVGPVTPGWQEMKSAGEMTVARR